MQEITGWIMLILGGILYAAQVISTIDFRLAQRLGIQENPDESDPLLQRAERYTAYWDLVTIGWLPLAGLLMIIDHAWWPIVALIGGSIYFDASGREAVKILSFRHEGIRVGAQMQQRLFFASYGVMALMAIVLMLYACFALLELQRNGTY